MTGLPKEVIEAKKLLESLGYRVTKPKTVTAAHTPALNAVGKPYGANFNPKIRTPLTSIARLSAPQNGFSWVK